MAKDKANALVATPLNPIKSPQRQATENTSIHIPPPPQETPFWRIGPKVHKTQEKCQNPPCWRIPNVPER